MMAAGLGVCLTLAATLGDSRAQIEPLSAAATQANMGTGFTYQGRLTSSGAPVNGTCDFQFGLWDALSGGTQIGTTLAKSGVSVTAGYFTISDLDFGANAFNGQARWLAISVRCPAGSGSYTALSPRQALTPAPHALALPGLWTQQNAVSPNLIGGHQANAVTNGAVGATIGGGGIGGYNQRVTDDYGTVGGGSNNQAGDAAGTTGDRPYATVAGGAQNTASGTAATIGGGRLNVAGGAGAFVGGGDGNTASGGWSTIGGGYGNTVSGIDAFVGGGSSNTASGSRSTVGGGDGNTASGSLATIPGGYGAVADRYGQMAYASGYFSNPGDAQTSVYILRGVTNGSSTATELFLDGSSERLTLLGRTIYFEAMIVGRDASGKSAGYRISGVVEDFGGTTAYVGFASVDLVREDDGSWDVAVTPDSSDASLRITALSPGSPARWIAVVRTVELKNP